MCPRSWQANTLVSFDISHAVDDSDIVFCLRLDRASTICSMLGSKGASRHRVSTSLDAFINLPTLNYLLAGIQLCYVPTHPEKSKWSELLHDLDQYRYPGPMQHLGLDDIRYIVRDLIRPFGVMRGSEKQGGQDETGLASATWPVNFVANLVLDVKERNIVNVWHNHDISAGDDLVLRLKPMPIPSDRDGGYTLNHYYKRYVQQNFSHYFQNTLGRARATHVWQLVPDTFSLDFQPENDVNNGAYPQPGRGQQRDPLPHVAMSPGFEVPRDFVWQELGFWHIGRSQVMVRRFAHKEYYYNDMANNLKINHLDMTFEPTWTKVPGEERDPLNLRAINDPTRANRGIDRRHILPGMMGAAFGDDEGGPSAKRVRWAPQLELERFLSEPMPEFDMPAPRAAAPSAADPLAQLFAMPRPPARPLPSADPLAQLFAMPRPPARPLPSADPLAQLFGGSVPARQEPAPAPWPSAADWQQDPASSVADWQEPSAAAQPDPMDEEFRPLAASLLGMPEMPEPPAGLGAAVGAPPPPASAPQGLGALLARGKGGGGGKKKAAAVDKDPP
jgi:hypothetical protein